MNASERSKDSAKVLLSFAVGLVDIDCEQHLILLYEDTASFRNLFSFLFAGNTRKSYLIYRTCVKLIN